MVDVKNEASSFRLLALIPPYNRTAACSLSDSEVVVRRKEITHESMHAILKELKNILNKPLDFLCADGKFRKLAPMLHFLNLDGQEISMHTMCSIANCPVCTVPRSELGNPDFRFDLRSLSELSGIQVFIAVNEASLQRCQALFYEMV